MFNNNQAMINQQVLTYRQETFSHSAVSQMNMVLKDKSLSYTFLLQTFLSELYVYLVDQMHQSLNKVLQIEDQPPIPPPLTTNAQLKHFAREAEVNKDFDLATKYYQEVSDLRLSVEHVLIFSGLLQVYFGYNVWNCGVML